MDPLYLSVLVAAEKMFWRCVQSGEVPHLIMAEQAAAQRARSAMRGSRRAAVHDVFPSEDRRARQRCRIGEKGAAHRRSGRRPRNPTSKPEE